MLRATAHEGTRAVEIELVDADVATAELLLNHVYGNEIEVPLSEALRLLDLASRLQVKSHLVWHLRLWLSIIDVQPDVLCSLLPEARRACPEACNASLYRQAAKCVSAISILPAFAGYWPLELVVEVVSRAAPLAGFQAAVAWVEGQPKPAGEGSSSPYWETLLPAIAWPRATQVGASLWPEGG